MKRVISWLSLSGLVTSLVGLLLMVSMAGAILSSDDQPSAGDELGLTEYGETEIPAQYIPIYKAAGKKYDIAWTLIAAFHKVETNFGTSESMVSYAGAIGHFQFLPETWIGWGYGTNPPKNVYENPAKINQYGGYGVDANNDGKADPYNIEDSAYSCANYVKASGGMDNLDKAIFAYNHADWYVERVKDYYTRYSKGDYNSSSGGGAIGSKGFMIPVKDPIISSPYSNRTDPFTGVTDFHLGLDFANPLGTPIMASKAGKVVIAQHDGAPVNTYGKCTILDHGDGTWTLYAHQSVQLVSVGDTVKQGQVIGKIGSTGRSTGPHLHLEIRNQFLSGQVDPAPILGIK